MTMRYFGEDNACEMMDKYLADRRAKRKALKTAQDVMAAAEKSYENAKAELEDATAEYWQASNELDDIEEEIRFIKEERD